jgi:hypothetical protein
MSRQVCTATLGALLALWLPAALPAQEAASGQPRFLDVSSQGYSRFEISGKDVIGYFTNGVEFDYLGYHLRSDELRYNHSTQAAYAKGNVALTVDGVTAYFAEIQLDGSQGTAVIPGALTGVVQNPAIGFEAASAQLSFPPGKLEAQLADITLTLSGPVKVTSAHQSVLQAESLTFQGSEMLISTAGPFTLTANYGQRTLADGNVLDLSSIILQGKQLSAKLREDGSIASAQGTEISLTTAQASLVGQYIEVTNLAPEGDEMLLWSAKLSGSPVTGRLDQPEMQVDFVASQVTSVQDANGFKSLNLYGNVELRYNGSDLLAEEVMIEQRAGGYALSMPQGMQASFDFSRYSSGIALPLLLDVGQGK